MTITRQIMSANDTTDAQKAIHLKEALERVKLIMKEVGTKASKNSNYYQEIYRKSEAIGCLPDDYYYGQNQRLRLYQSDSYYHNSNLAEINGALSHLESKMQDTH